MKKPPDPRSCRPNRIVAPEPPGGYPHPHHDPHRSRDGHKPGKPSLVDKLPLGALSRDAVWIMSGVLVVMVAVLIGVMVTHP